MQRDLSDIGTPRDWIKRARSNLIRAQQPKNLHNMERKPATVMQPTITEQEKRRWNLNNTNPLTIPLDRF